MTMQKLFMIFLLSTAALSGSDSTIKGVVVDPAGATVANARAWILDQNGATLDETKTSTDGKFELKSGAGKFTVMATASGFNVFKKEIDVSKNSVQELEVKLTVGCSGDIPRIIPIELDLSRFLVEIHYRASFGNCPERIYRLWGTGEASMIYLGCGGKTYRENRQIKLSTIASTLTKLASKSGPVCSYYLGGIDAPSVELTLFSGNEPRLVILHDEGSEIENVTPVEQELQKLIDPEGRMESFRKRSRQALSQKP